jgi:hypothetical protein
MLKIVGVILTGAKFALMPANSLKNVQDAYGIRDNVASASFFGLTEIKRYRFPKPLINQGDVMLPLLHEFLRRGVVP